MTNSCLSCWSKYELNVSSFSRLCFFIILPFVVLLVCTLTSVARLVHASYLSMTAMSDWTSKYSSSSYLEFVGFYMNIRNQLMLPTYPIDCSPDLAPPSAACSRDVYPPPPLIRLLLLRAGPPASHPVGQPDLQPALAGVGGGRRPLCPRGLQHLRQLGHLHAAGVRPQEGAHHLLRQGEGGGHVGGGGRQEGGGEMTLCG